MTRSGRAALKAAVKRQPATYRLARIVFEAQRRRRQSRTWTAPYLSPAAKVAELRQYGRAYGLRVFVETGTYEGETTYRLRREFDRLYTVELDPELARLARLRFARLRHVTPIEADGPSGLATALREIEAPTLFRSTATRARRSRRGTARRL